jgi:outer membrane protein assembly factor BamB
MARLGDLAKVALVTAGLFAICAGMATAEHTRRWRQSTYEEFLKGTTHGIAVRSDGRLELAPKFTQLADADASYLWAVKLDAKGTPYAAGGSPAKVFKLDTNGKAATVFESSDLSAQAIAFDAKGTLFVGTSPDGKVYKVSASGEKSVFFDPKTKYIWDIAFAPDGTLYVGTGDKGQIYAVAPDGKSELFYASDEAHIRVIAFDGKGNVIVGTEPSGRVLRLTKTKRGGAAEGFVLYETPKREITALAVGSDGSIFAAAIGERQHNAAVNLGMSSATTTTMVTSGGNVTVISPAQGTQQQAPTPFIAFPPQISSGIYKIAPDGAPEELWTSRDDVVYSLGIGGDGRLLAGLGNTGALLAIDGKGVFAQLAKAGSAQITGIVRNGAGKIFLCTANPGKLIALGPEYEPEGTYESRSFDTQLFSQWGRVEWWGPAVADGKNNAAKSKEPRLELYVRSGNTEDPGKEWSKWYGPYSTSGAQAEAPPARFAQWKAVIHDGRPGDGIEWVSLAYEPKNVAPVIDGITIQEPGVRAQPQPNLATGGAPVATLKYPPAQPTSGGVILNQTQATTTTKFEAPPQATVQKGYQTVVWTAHDDNEDELKYGVYFRGEGEKEWKLLKDNLEQKFYSFDTTTLADGAYYLKIVASDAASNAPDKALRTERESERFEVDNTPPVVGKIEFSFASNYALQLKFTASDAGSNIERAQYSVDGGEWLLIAPKAGISDGKQESYQFTVNGLKAGEHTIAVRVYDRFENVGNGKVMLGPPEGTTVIN